MNALHEIFVDNYLGMALIKSLEDDELLYCNQNYKCFLEAIETEECSKNHLSKLILASSDPLEECSLQFCKHVDLVFKESKLPLFAKEVFNKEKYITYRTLIKYKGVVSVLLLINRCNIDKSCSDINEIDVMDVCHDMMKCCNNR